MSDHESPLGATDRGSDAKAPRRVPIERPGAPVAERLNRNALIVAACVLGMAALVAVVFLVPAKVTTTGAANTRPAPPAPPPSFMDRPGPFDQPRSPTPGDTMRVFVPPPIGTDSTRRGDRYTVAATGDNSIYRSPAVAAPRMRTDGEDEYRLALHSPLIAVGMAVEHGAVQPDDGAADAAAVRIGDRPHPEGSDVMPAGYATKAAVARRHDEPVSGISVTARRSRDGFLLVAGSVVSAVLVTALNSDLPGDVGAQVTRDVYDSPTQSVVLIPRGAKLVGHLASGVVHGQKRIALAWVRINLPNGDVINLPGQPSTDERGAAGVAADVDNHIFRTFGAAGVAAAIGAGAELSQPQNGTSVLTTPTVGQVLAGSLGQELGTVGLEIVRRELDVPPTLTLPPGALFDLLLTTDLSFRQRYGATAP